MNDRITEIRQRCEKATEGPWEHTPERYFDVRKENKNIASCAELKDSKFIAHAREDIPYLLAEIDRLTKERDAAVEDLRWHGDCDTCENYNTLDCHIDAETGSCNYEWRGVQK